MDLPKAPLIPTSHDQKEAWHLCSYCKDISFSSLQSFIRHLRTEHCTIEGGSFVCQYGENRVCCSLPVEGVSDADYERHVYRHHAFPNEASLPVSHNTRHRRETMGTLAKVEKSGDKWTVYSAAQNLPAVLNDPGKGKQKDFFTRTWGESFVEVNHVPGPHYLPQITAQHFELYLRRTAKRYRRHAKLNVAVPKSNPSIERLQHFPNLIVSKSGTSQDLFDLSSIPKIFLQPNFDLSCLETFSAVFPLMADTPFSPNSPGNLLQEKLSHYMDIVEVQIAQQVALKKDAFFVAMMSHDALMEQLAHNISIVHNLRGKLQHIDSDLVKESFQVIKWDRSRAHRQVVLRKLRLMSTVLQTQPTIKLLLSTPDYVAALELIYVTQETLGQELAGIHGLRHLGSELSEMIKVIDTLMAGEFERYATSDLNRPLLESESNVLEGDKLSCIVMGMMRRGCLDFVEAYQRETVAAIKAAVKQAVIEVVSLSDTACQADMTLDEQLKGLAIEEWTQLLGNATTALLRLVCRVKNACDVIQRAANASAGQITAETDDGPSTLPISAMSPEPGDWQLSGAEHERVSNKLRSLLLATCQYAQERCAQLLSSRTLLWPEDKEREDASRSGKISQNGLWIAERATLTQLSELSRYVETLSSECERICPNTPVSILRSAFKSQANRFMQRFHFERIMKLTLILDSEDWRQTDVPVEFQQLVNHIAESGNFSVSKGDLDQLKTEGEQKPQSSLYVGNEKFAVVGSVLMLFTIVSEYCVRAEDLSLSAHSLLRYLAELLLLFNSRCCQLVLGAEAVSDRTGLKKITSTNLALVLRVLQLLLWLLPHVRLHFQGLLADSLRITNLDHVSQQVKTHARDVYGKLLSFMEVLLASELKQWEAKPPVPSKPFQNISKHLRKLHEAVSNILPESQMADLFREINTAFKETLADNLARLHIINDGGPLHGLVTSELIFYLEDLKRIKALPESELEVSLMVDIWTLRMTR